MKVIHEAGAGIIGGVVDISAERVGTSANLFHGDLVVKGSEPGRLGKILMAATNEDDPIIKERLQFLKDMIDPKDEPGLLPIVAATREKLIDETCTKLIGNTAANLRSTITGLKLNELLSDSKEYDLEAKMMSEVFDVLKHVGMSENIVGKYNPERALDYKKGLDHLASTAVDFENGKPTEVDVLTGAVIELADFLKEQEGIEVDISTVRQVHGNFMWMRKQRDKYMKEDTKLDPASAAKKARDDFKDFARANRGIGPALTHQ